MVHSRMSESKIAEAKHFQVMWLQRGHRMSLSQSGDKEATERGWLWDGQVTQNEGRTRSGGNRRRGHMCSDEGCDQSSR